MDRTNSTVDCTDCAHPIPLADFVDWGAQSVFKTTACTRCGTTVTYPSASDGSLVTTGAPIGRGAHGTTRESRGMEVLVSRPALEQQQ
jgi:hypothetical protein